MSSSRSQIPSLHDRASGVLLHPTSLPGPFGSGDLGPAARRFVDFLQKADQRWWQMLPIAPPGYGGSPYSAESAFAGSPALISLEMLADEGLLERADVERDAAARATNDPVEGLRIRERHLQGALAALKKRPPGSDERAAFERFCEENGAAWLNDFALFSAVKRAHGDAPWPAWEPSIRDREPAAMVRAESDLRDAIELKKFEQHVFAEQWRALKSYCADRGIGLIGDIPIFVAHDSADVWQRRSIFRLDEAGQPIVVAGVPPDYFSKTGQRWGNPLYRWRKLKKQKYSFWVERIGAALGRFDALRLDHFIGFVRYWAIPASCPTAVEGSWKEGPGADLFKAIRKAHGSLPLIAEDLGAVTPEVKALRDRFKLPGLRVLQFAFGDDPSAPDFLPHNYPRRTVVYTGTHDNDTTVGWFSDMGGGHSTRSPGQTAVERETAMRYLGSDGRAIHWDMIRMALLSVADLSIIPAQDLLGLGTEARMNRPGELAGNWAWRLRDGALTDEIGQRLRGLTRTYGRGRDQ